MPRTLTTLSVVPPAGGGPDLVAAKASMADIPALLELINAYAARGIMLPRTEFEMAENIRDFTVIRAAEQVVGCGALHFYTPAAAEVRSLAIAPAFHGQGAGKRLIDSLEAEAQAFGLESVFAFTYIPDFFLKMGFVEIERGELPLKAWKDCLRCPKFQCCDEIAVIKHLVASSVRVGDTRNRGTSTFDDTTPANAIQLPVLNRPR